MAELWPFRPMAGSSGESLAWLTDSLAGRTGEQRIALRSAPRQTFNYTCRLDHHRFMLAKSYARRNGALEVAVPVWMEGTRVAGAVASAATVIALDTADADYREGGDIAIWESDLKAVTATIDTIAADSLTLTAPVGTGFTSPTIAPVRTALPIEGFRFNPFAVSADVTARFQVVDNIDLSGEVLYPQYLGLDVLTEPPSSTGDIAQNIVRAAEYIDNGFGPVAVETLRNYADFGQTIGFLEEGKAALWRRRQWLHNLRGKQKPFWQPSFAMDLRLQAAIGGSAVNLNVASVAPTGFYVGRHVMIELKNGTRFLREITGAAAAGGGVDQLTIAALGTAVDPADIRLFCFMAKVRLNSDTVTINYRATDLASLSIPTMEVPA